MLVIMYEVVLLPGYETHMFPDTTDSSSNNSIVYKKKKFNILKKSTCIVHILKTITCEFKMYLTHLMQPRNASNCLHFRTMNNLHEAECR